MVTSVKYRYYDGLALDLDSATKTINLLKHKLINRSGYKFIFGNTTTQELLFLGTHQITS